AFGFEPGERLVGLPLGLGFGFYPLLCVFLGLPQRRRIAFGLALRRQLGFALRRHRRLVLLRRLSGARRNACLELGQFLLGLLARLAGLLELALSLPLGLGVGLSFLPRFLLQLALLGGQRIGLAPLGQRLLELLGRQARRRGADRGWRA